MRYLSICSGIGSDHVAWSPLGWECAAFAEIEPHACAVLAERFPHIPNLGDFTKIEASDVGPVDLVCGGTPCQAFSVAGLRGGLDDSRGNLALEYCRLLGRTRPDWFLWENVPGVFSSTSHDAPDPCPPEDDMGSLRGRQPGDEDVVEDEYDADESHAFACILAGFQELGYGFAYRTLDTQYIRVESHPRAAPQRRKRVFVVGYLGDWRPSVAVLLEPESLRGDHPPRRTSGKDVAGTLTKSLGSGGPDDNQARDGQLVAGSLASRVSAGGGLGTDVECDGGVVVHEEVAGAVSAKWAKGSGGPAGDECYNLVPHPAPASPALTGNPYGDHESREGLLVAHTRRAEGHDATEDGTGRGTPIIPFDTTQITNKDNYSHPKPGDPCHPLTAEGHPPAIAFSCKDHGGDVSEDVSPTLRVMPPDKSHANAGGQVAVAIQERMESLNPENGPHGKGWSDDGAAFTLEARHRPQSVLAVADTVRSHPRPGSNSTGNIVAVAVDTRQDPCVYEEHTGAVDASFPPQAVGVSLREREGGNTAELHEGVSPSIRSGAGGSDKQHVLTDMMVRRLTPRECERLQGLDDDWTLVPYRGKPMADGPRYMMVGNGISINTLSWIGQRLALFLKVKAKLT